jgi:hypothetical protein
VIDFVEGICAVSLANLSKRIVLETTRLGTVILGYLGLRVHFIFGRALHKPESLPGITGYGLKMSVLASFCSVQWLSIETESQTRPHREMHRLERSLQIR